MQGQSQMLVEPKATMPLKSKNVGQLKDKFTAPQPLKAQFAVTETQVEYSTSNKSQKV